MSVPAHKTNITLLSINYLYIYKCRHIHLQNVIVGEFLNSAVHNFFSMASKMLKSIHMPQAFLLLMLS